MDWETWRSLLEQGILTLLAEEKETLNVLLNTVRLIQGNRFVKIEPLKLK